MISIVIACETEDRPVMATLAALVPGAAAGLIRDAILVDRTGSEAIARVADVAGCELLRFSGSHAGALTAGVKAAGAPWLLFLPPGAIPEAGWVEECARFINEPDNSDHGGRAAAFSYARRPYARFGLANMRKALMRAVVGPAPQQGLLISRSHYERVGGHRAERDPQAALNRRIGRSALVTLTTRATMV